MAADISLNAVTSTTAEIVLTERTVSNEFVIVEIQENIQNRFVRAEIELGPFTEDKMPGGNSRRRGSSRRSIQVWSDDAYDAVALTWDNAALVKKVTELLAM
jgi:hypothetical protein